MVLVLLGFVLLIYANHFDNPFEFDDSHTIENNLFIRDIGNIPLFFKDATTFSSLPQNQSYRPIVSTTLAIDYWLAGGLDPVYFHASTFIWFLVQGVFMFLMFKVILSKVSDHEWVPWIALFATAWYMVHAVNAETINYIISRSDSISTLFVVLALYMYAVGGVSRKFFLYLIPLVLGILTKPTAVMFIPILWAYIFLFEDDKTLGRNIVNALKTNLAHLVIVPVVAAAGYLLVDHMTPSSWVPGGTSKWQYLATQPYVILHYFKMFFLPTELSADTDWEVFRSFTDYRALIGYAFIAVMTAIAIYTALKKELRPISFGIIWFFVALIPTSSIIPLAEVMNDHRMYFPFVGLVLSIVWALALILIKLKGSGRFTPIVQAGVGFAALFIILSFGYGTYIRNEVWGSAESLWKDVTIKSPHNGRGQMNYGLALMEKGQYPEAIEAYNQALKYVPDYAYLHINMGVVYNAINNQDKARYHFEKALQLRPDLPESNYFYANWLFGRGEVEKAKVLLQKTIRLAPAHQQARYLLMAVLAQQKDYASLKALAEETLRYMPNDPKATQYLAIANSASGTGVEDKIPELKTAEDYLDLSLTYYQAGAYRKCIEACLAALKLKPDYPEAYNNICSSHNMLGEWDAAKAACEMALKLSPDFELAKNNLKWANDELKKQQDNN